MHCYLLGQLTVRSDLILGIDHQKMLKRLLQKSTEFHMTDGNVFEVLT